MLSAWKSSEAITDDQFTGSSECDAYFRISLVRLKKVKTGPEKGRSTCFITCSKFECKAVRGLKNSKLVQV